MNKVAAIQMASGPNVSANLIEAGRLLAMAAESGAQLVVLPENFALMGMTEQDKVEQREREGAGQIQEFLSRQAERHEIWIVGGTIPLESPDSGKIRAACLVYDAAGRQVARYDKIHLFDVALRESGEEYNESATIQPGSVPVVLDTPFGRLGLAVCYDLRFPELFRTLAGQGAELIALPAAFTAITGRAHWEVLVRARAIENLCYLIASAQGGYHVSGRITHGDSMIVDPWGAVLDRLPSGSGIVMAEIDSRELHDRRRAFPALEHRRLA
ncbi:MAG TPA: carbon-nitrogen hydrolase family protein [Gammaproteobacteria bacterium]|nr:carbon-nitrogen hydrolase family protein [Gammaproteobacteria bacterium]